MDKTRRITVGNVAVGGGAPVTIQSMTNTDTADVEATSAQILRLEEAGCQIVRASVYNEDCARAIPAIKDRISIPLVADIHFDYRLAISAMEHGADKIRFNPGNIGGEGRVKKLVDCAKRHSCPIRVGVNGGSLERELLDNYGGPTPEALVESALKHIALLEREGFYDTVISIKASNPRDTVTACRMLSHSSDYPQHVGVTEAGSGEMALIKSSAALGALLIDGIGDTVRVSITGDPVQEVLAAKNILRALGLRREGVEIVSCPTCGRTCTDLLSAVQEVEAALPNDKGYLRIAVMGCVVNGPGEAREADLGIAFGPGGCALFKRGEMLRTVPLEGAVQELIAEAKRMLE